MLLAILIVCSISLIGLSAVSATDPITSSDTPATNDTSDNQTTTPATNDTSDNQTTTPIQSTASQAAGSPPVMKAYWMWASSVASADAANLQSKGITDVFVLTRGVAGTYHYAELQNAIAKFKPYGIKVHAWVVCFKNGGNFVNPSGYYCYTNKIYVKTTRYWGKKKIAYKVKKKVRYKKVGKRWKYKYTYVIKYRYRKGWIYTPIYRYETISGYDASYNDRLVNEIANINNNYDVDGIHLDYVRYSGVTQYGNAACQQPGGTEAAVNTVTGFVQRVRGVVTKQLSAAVMPEGDSNPSAYAQDYGRLADCLDFFVPMIYEGNYNANNAWITSATRYIVDRANGKPVYSGLTTYYSDNNPGALSQAELDADAQSAHDGGALGYVLFRYGIGNIVPNWPWT